MPLTPKTILIVYCHSNGLDTMRLAIKRHLLALASSPVKHNLMYFNALEDTTIQPGLSSPLSPPPMPSQLKNIDFDVIILHTTFLCYRWTGDYFYQWKNAFNWIGDLNALKIALPQDEYDHSELLDEWLFTWKVDVIFTVLDADQRPTLYPLMHTKAAFYKCLTGYIDNAALHEPQEWPPLADRPYDIVYRASKLPYWFGSQGQRKHEIASLVAARAPAHSLKINISTRVEDVILGSDWLPFLASGRTVIGCESGSSALDRRGEMQFQIRTLLKKEPSLTFTDVNCQMPADWDSYRFFTLSPRHFEAIETKTCQILCAGSYDGVLIPDKHYVPLNHDYSNLDAVLTKIKDQSYIQSITEQAYIDIYLSGKFNYISFANLIDRAIFDNIGHKKMEIQSDNNIIVESLERQIVAERHNNAFLHSKLLESESFSPKKFIKDIFRRKKYVILLLFSCIAFIFMNALFTTALIWFFLH